MFFILLLKELMANVLDKNMVVIYLVLAAIFAMENDGAQKMEYVLEMQDKLKLCIIYIMI